jgi:glucokinase
MPNLGSKSVLAIDIGGTNTRFGVIDIEGRLIGEMNTFPVPFRVDGSADEDELIALIQQQLKQARQTTDLLPAIGISLCGNVERSSGEAVLVPNLHWANVPFGQMIRDRCGIEVQIATDVRQAALAEALWGAARGRRNFLWATVGTGYGGYLFLNGRLYGGAHGFAGNFGHTPLDDIDGYMCGCGHRGCVETFVSGPAIARAGQIAVAKQQSPILTEMADSNQGQVTAPMVFSACDAGDETAQRILDRVTFLICQNLGGAVNLLDLELIIFGGGVCNGSEWFVEGIDRRIRDFLMTAEARRDLRIVRESFPDSALWGAAGDVFANYDIIGTSLLEP